VSTEFYLLILGAYVLGSVPLAYFIAKRSLGIDIREHGSGNVGASNLLSLTSWRIAAPVFVFDFLKGMIAVWLAWHLSFSLTKQTFVALAVICGHNWSPFLRFRGGRGVLTTLGAALMIPALNDVVSERMLIVVGVVLAISILAGTFALRVGPVAVFAAIASLPVLGFAFREPTEAVLGLLGMFVILVIRRLTAEQPIRVTSMSRRQLLLNRLLFDRDIRDKNIWLSLVSKKERSRKGKVGRSAE
jgi:glycerol-3-phosphate acyltransferase PlsY